MCINISYCGSLWPAARIRSGDTIVILLQSANVAIKAVDSVMLLISFDSSIFD